MPDVTIPVNMLAAGFVTGLVGLVGTRLKNDWLRIGLAFVLSPVFVWLTTDIAWAPVAELKGYILQSVGTFGFAAGLWGTGKTVQKQAQTRQKKVKSDG